MNTQVERGILTIKGVMTADYTNQGPKALRRLGRGKEKKKRRK
jgi:hypothetical protein